MLGPNTALIEYFVGIENCYAFSLTKEQIKVHQWPKSKQFEQNISEIRNFISQPPFQNTSTDARDDFIRNSSNLNQQIMAPILAALPPSVSELVIVPDDILNYIPFGVLITKPSSDPLEYLIKHYAISYNYSANLWLHFSKASPSNHTLPFLGIAPNFSKNVVQSDRACIGGEIYALKCNKTEIENINQLMGGQTLYDQQANQQQFEALAGTSKILHLATHACSDEEEALNKIFFSDDFILGTDLNKLKLGNDLVVLSACNTGSGKLQKGEGVLSLSRGFILAGCSSTLTSMWSVDDCTTSEVMVDFYQNLLVGNSKNKALQQTKINHLAKADQVLSHPYYWAAFVQSGNPDPIQQSSGMDFWKTLFMTFAALLIAMFAWQNFSS